MLIHELRLAGLLSFGPDTPPLAMERLNILIGPNGSGKSNFIEAIALLRSAATKLTTPIREKGGGGVIEWIGKGKPNGMAAIDATIKLDGEPDLIRHSIEFCAESQRFVLLDERIGKEVTYPSHPDSYYFYRILRGTPLLMIQDRWANRRCAMVKTVTIYLEGGGDSEGLRSRCREGFRKLFQGFGFKRMPKLVACGGRGNAFDRFCKAHADGKEDAILLIDGEDSVADIEKTWLHLKLRDNWDKPDVAQDEQVLLMTTCMETWIVADQAALQSFYKSDLKENQLPTLIDLEGRERHAVQGSLQNATKDYKNKYEKGKRSFDVLAVLTRATLEQHLPSFKRARRELAEKLGEKQ